MTRRTAGSRSFLRQLAEPIPHAIAPLVSRGPAAPGRAATVPARDLIPQILEAIDPASNAVAENRSTHASVAAPVTQETPATESNRVRTTVPPHESLAASQQRHGNTAPAAAQTSYTHEPAQQSASRENPRANKTRSMQPAGKVEFSTPHSLVAETSTPQSNKSFTRSNVIAFTPEHRSETRVHIGTVEVRIPAPPAHILPQPGATAIRAAGRGTQRAPGVATEPLARGLAWNHGLIQG